MLITLLACVFITDTITKHSGLLIDDVQIKKVDGRLVYYQKNGSSVERVMSRMAIAKIEFQDGTVEVFDKPTDVIVTDDKNVIEGLVFLGEVEAISLWGGISAQDLGRNKVDKKLKARAMRLGGCVILADVTSSFGGASGKAKVYGTHLSYSAARNFAEGYLAQRRFLTIKLISAKRSPDTDFTLEYKARNRGTPKYYKVKKALFEFKAEDEGEFKSYFAGKDGEWVPTDEWE